MKKVVSIFWKFAPFWFFLLCFRLAGGLHYSLIAPLGEQLLPLWVVGLLMGGGAFLQLILDVPAGYILDRYGYLKLLKITTFIFLGAAICLILGLTKTTFIISILIATFGWLFYGPGESAYTLSHAPKATSGRFIAFRDVFSSSGSTLASVLLPFALMLTPMNMGYTLFVVLLSGLILLFFSPRDTQSVHKEIKLPTQHHYIRRQSLVAVWRALQKLNPASTTLLLLNLAASTFYGVIWFVVPLVIVHQANAGVLSIGLGIFDFAIVTLGFLLGNLADKFNKRSLVFFGLLIFAISSLILGFNFGLLFLLFGFLATAGDEMAGLSLWSWLYTLDKDHAHDGAVAGALSFSQDIGWTIGPVAAGIIYTFVGPSWTIALGAVPIFIVWGIYWFMMHKHRPDRLIRQAIAAKPRRLRHKT